MSGALDELKEAGREIYLLGHAGAVLGWDQETYMPPAAVEERSEQLSLLEGLLHDRLTDSRLKKLFDELGATEENPAGTAAESEVDRGYVRKFFRDYTLATKLPKKLVVELARQSSIGQNRWGEARKESDFSLFEPVLTKLLELSREKAELYGYENHPYDALIDQYEPGMRTAKVKKVFDDLIPGLKNLLGKIETAEQVENGFLHAAYPVELQRQFSREVLEDIGYDFERGRLDDSAHPFTTTLGADDVRVTSRYNDSYFPTGIFGVVHECGHGLYELGFSDEIRGNILADGASLGIHESQSRMWENIIGRSRFFWQRYFTRLGELFPQPLLDTDEEAFFRAINKVEPSFIRIDADEVTYNLHIALRFGLELDMISGKLPVRNLPDEWNRRFTDLLGLTPADDAEGVLQDIHWSFAAFGYFPTYTLGNLYGAQFFSALERDLPDWAELIRTGDFSSLLTWMRERLHRHGSVYTSEELCERVTGAALDPRHFIQYLNEKFGSVYELSGD